MAINAEQVNRQGIDPFKVAIYVRWSTDDQGDGTTLEQQLAGCQHYILSQGWAINKDLIFIDDGYSGGTLERPAMTKLREAVKNGKIHCVVVFKLDRLSRSVIDTVNLVLDEWDGLTELKSAREPIDTTTPMGKQFFYILTSFAEWERSVIRERTYGGKIQRAKEGKNPGFTPPYGYNVGEVPGTVVINEEEAAIVRRIFRDYISGKGSVKIAHELNSEGIRFRKGRLWNEYTVRYILRNEFYTGKLVYGKESVNPKRDRGGKYRLKNNNYLIVESAEITPIIDQETFDLVAEVRKSRRYEAPRSVSSPYLLSGLLVCDNCGHSVGATERNFYLCRGVHSKGKKFCNAGRIKQEKLNAEVIRRIKEKFLSEENQQSINRMISEYFDRIIEETKAALSMQKKELAEFEKQLTRLDTDYRHGDIDGNTHARLTKAIVTDIEDIKRAIQDNEEKVLNYGEQREKLLGVKEFVSALKEWELLSIENQRILLKRWIKYIKVFKPSGIGNPTYLDIVYRLPQGASEQLVPQEIHSLS